MLDLRTSLLLAGALLGASLAPLGSSSIAVAIPLIAISIETDPATVTRLLVGGYLFISIVGQVPGGRLADRYGCLPILYAGLTIFVAGCVLGYLVEHIAALTVSRMAMAMGTALIGPATAALVRIQVPVPRLAFAFGIYSATMSGAATLGPWIGGLVVSQQHWSWVFAINLPVAAMAGLLIYFSIDRHESELRGNGSSARLPADWQGLALLAAAVLCLQVGLGYPSVTLLLGAVVCFFLFYRNETRHPSPIIHGDLFGNRIFLRCCAVNALNNFTMYSVLFQVPILLVVLGVTDPLRAGTVLLAMTLAMMISGAVSGVVADRFGYRTTLTVAQLLGLAGVLSLTGLLPDLGAEAVMPSIALVGLSVGMVMALIRAIALGSVAAAIAGTAEGASNTARYIGGALGIACLSAILATGQGLDAHLAVLQLYVAALVLMLLMIIGLPQRIEGSR